MKNATIINELVASVQAIAGEEFTVTSQLVTKVNCKDRPAILIKTEDEPATPTIYLEEILEKIQSGEYDIPAAAHEVLESYLKFRKPPFQFDTAGITSKDFILSHVEYEVISAERNQGALEQIPNRRIQDLAAVFRVFISRSDEENSSFILNNEVMKKASIAFEELDAAASTNTMQKGFQIKSLPETLGLEPDDGPAIYVLSTGGKQYGASFLLYEDNLKAVAEKIGGDYYILPSSIHELLALPDMGADASALREMVQNVNDFEVAPDEILSYEVYRYNSETETLLIAD